MKNLLLTFLMMVNFSTYIFAQENEDLSLLQQDGMAQNQPETYTKYTLENENVKILVFKIDYGEPATDPLHFSLYFQCKSNNKYHKLNQEFNNTSEREMSYCGHKNFYLGTIKDKGDKKFLILPMKKDTDNSCPKTSNSIEVYPIDEMIQKCNQ